MLILQILTKPSYLFIKIRNQVALLLLKLIKNRLYNNKQLEDQKNLIFVLSPGRSGSTILRKELIKNGIGIPPESYGFIPKFALWYAWNWYASWETIIEVCLRIFKRNAPLKHWQIDEADISRKLESLPKSEQTFYACVYTIYHDFIHRHYGNTPYWGDKTPYLTLFVRFLRVLFPNAKYVAIIRPSDKVIKSRMANFNESSKKATNRYCWAIKEIKKLKRITGYYPIITLENFTRNRTKAIEYIFNAIAFKRRPIKEKNIFLGDEYLPHHQNVMKNIYQHSYNLNINNDLDEFYRKVYLEEHKNYID